ncbi:MAG: hypothetical protein IT334_00150 [Thermomicrobiales bacterium]|nr:hypothetical protein [Thermomicrobiales bacterium]
MTLRRDPPVVGLKAEVERLRRGQETPAVKLDPASAYEAVTRQMVEGMRDELREIRGRINGLLFLMIGALGIEAILRIAWG